MKRTRSISSSLMWVLLFGVTAMAGEGAPGSAESGTATAKAGPFGLLDRLVGEWRGLGVFPDRKGYIHKTYAFELGRKYLVERTIDMWPPKEPSPDFHIHRDISFFYLDGGQIKVKSFHGEGFVWNAEVTLGEAGESFVIETRSVEGGPPGFRARVSYTFKGPDSLEAVFALGMPGQPLKVLENLTLKRMSR
ncbi:hypothetical protein SCOR_05875 [Sulfidibacter corallicola]|uniref:THAP4-like heme-binding beta-barrel domain-containing protein n=1 Tax=Sulfidibacter corallicola TaxID=2818388 RepID=A0A8A4TQ66_SULCO|nr:hypothetical protein [Sulfidibacter corallicola]QTD51700.1 hypothetical protein J3U87_04450 [Sulfidibacter corallicola]